MPRNRLPLVLATALLTATAAVAVPALAHADTHPVSTEIPVAPYIDITRDSPTLPEVAEETGQQHFTLAFILASANGCEPAWGGEIPLEESRIIDQITQLRADGGDVIVASGGAVGNYLETACDGEDELYDAYSAVLDATGGNHLDIDVEASIPHQTVNAALKRLQDERDTTVSYTLRVQGQDYGVDPSSVAILEDAAAQDVDVIVNPMLMNFGYEGDWGQAMVDAAEAALGQVQEIWPDYSPAEAAAHLGITPMIGHNDSGMVTTQDDAETLLSWARENEIGFIGFWSIGRDNGSCPDGGVQPDCSGLSQSDYEFTGIFAGFGR